VENLPAGLGRFGLIYFTYNFRRILNILGIEGLKNRLKELFLLILAIRSCLGYNRLFIKIVL